jgi:8-oxo-dGTP diphosphatase
MISKDIFDNFNSKFVVVGCFIEHNDDILLIKRQKDKDNGNKWAVPSGKVDPGETEEEAVIREVFEETGLKIYSDKLVFVERSYVRFPGFDFIYTFFKYDLNSKEKPKIILSEKEHTAYKWIIPKDALNEDLMQDEDYCIKVAYNL